MVKKTSILIPKFGNATMNKLDKFLEELNNEYEPCGDEWKAYVMKMRKWQIVKLFADVIKERNKLKEENIKVEKNYLSAVGHRTDFSQALREARDELQTLKDAVGDQLKFERKTIDLTLSAFDEKTDRMRENWENDLKDAQTGRQDNLVKLKELIKP